MANGNTKKKKFSGKLPFILIALGLLIWFVPSNDNFPNLRTFLENFFDDAWRCPKGSVSIYPDSADFNPYPSPIHKTWGGTPFVYNPNFTDPRLITIATDGGYVGAGGKQTMRPVYPNRLPHPTIWCRSKKDPDKFFVSLDGTNEWTHTDKSGAHTSEGTRVPMVGPDQAVIIRYVSGQITNLFGRPEEIFCGTDESSILYPGEGYIIRFPDGKDQDAMGFQLRARNGKNTGWVKMCDPVSQLPEMVVVIPNTLQEPAFIDMVHNDQCPWFGHDGGKPTWRCTLQDAGRDGSRATFLVQIVAKVWVTG